MSQRAERLLSYGTLQQENVQRATFGRLLNGTPDALVGFKQSLVEITDPDVLAKSGERFHPIVTRSGDAADRVAGTVFEITAAESRPQTPTKSATTSALKRYSHLIAKPGCM